MTHVERVGPAETEQYGILLMASKRLGIFFRYRF